jgi:hypothetical protein
LAYQEALRLASEDPEAGLRHYEAILAVFGGGESKKLTETDKRWLDLARKQVVKLEPEVERLKAEQQKAVRQQLGRARELAASDRQAAEAIWRGIVTLYGNKTWAAELVEEAEAELETARTTH